MIRAKEFLDYVDKFRINPTNAKNMAMTHYHRGVLSLPDYLKIRGVLESNCGNERRSK